jgi:hypothetical protein
MPRNEVKLGGMGKRDGMRGEALVAGRLLIGKCPDDCHRQGKGWLGVGVRLTG